MTNKAAIAARIAQEVDPQAGGFSRRALERAAMMGLEAATGKEAEVLDAELNEQPRRRVVMIAKFGADDWKTLQHDLMHLATEIARHGHLSASSVSGGYSSGHIIVTSEDGSIDHDSWARELDQYLEALKQREARR